MKRVNGKPCYCSMLTWIINNLLTEEQLDVVPPEQTQSIRHIDYHSLDEDQYYG